MIPPFRPAPWLPGRHLQTIVPALGSGPRVSAATEPLVVSVADGSSIRLDVDRPAASTPRGTLLLIHGLGGSADSGYMRATARDAVERGWIAARMNLRNCGGTEAMARTLYNAGQSADAGCALAALEAGGFPRPFAAIGFSLGGNLLLRYAGISGKACGADAVAGINPPVRLERCMQALERPANRIYELYFTILLARQVASIRRVRPLPGPPANVCRLRTVRRFDALFTAPDAGYPSAEAYYEAASAAPFLAAVRRPALVLSAANDPFVPVATYDGLDLAAGTDVVLVPHGGHVGYRSDRPPRFWAGPAARSWLEEAV